MINRYGRPPPTKGEKEDGFTKERRFRLRRLMVRRRRERPRSDRRLDERRRPVKRADWVPGLSP